MEPIFQLSKDELEKVISLLRGIAPDVDTRPTKAKHKIENLAKYFEAHLAALNRLSQK